jgi:hypothetical protein
MEKLSKKEQGKKNKKDGAKFELSVRKQLESEGWIVCKWNNNVEFSQGYGDEYIYNVITENKTGILIPAKHKFNPFQKVMSMGTGFPDFICFKLKVPDKEGEETYHKVIGVEAKSNGYLDKEEKEKCKWLLDNNIFSKILIASKITEKDNFGSPGEIKFIEFEKEVKNNGKDNRTN